MPKYYLKSTNANVEILCQYLNHTKCLQMQNIKENGIKIIRKNVLSTICNLNIKHPTGNQHISIIGQKRMSNSHQIHHQLKVTKSRNRPPVLTPILKYTPV